MIILKYGTESIPFLSFRNNIESMALISYCTGVFKDPQDEKQIGIDGIQQSL